MHLVSSICWCFPDSKLGALSWGGERGLYLLKFYTLLHTVALFLFGHLVCVYNVYY